MASDDPDFQTKTAVIGLYMAPPQHAAVFYGVCSGDVFYK